MSIASDGKNKLLAEVQHLWGWFVVIDVTVNSPSLGRGEAVERQWKRTLFYDLNCTEFWVYQLLGEAGTYYGVRFGKNLPWVTEFPFGYIKDPQYVGSILSLLACLCWVPFQYIFLWILGYVFMIWVESTEDPTTRAKPLN
ncbi:hypothetical protein C4D60_Mb05t13260 [Musa balbisiana]|uniref:phosphatidyl-N-methylethanolamine N-methyltransferase n=1 Tax=Musa balbisiana TaxID=52838 RepID=A0A4S8JVT3_MUSBA|nr:hypothetical protein C4D60_Mb05t13260 [Musa balbisiana]